MPPGHELRLGKVSFGNVATLGERVVHRLLDNRSRLSRDGVNEWRRHDSCPDPLLHQEAPDKGVIAPVGSIPNASLT